jgi:hypothetical protein
MVTAIHDDLFAPEVIADPYTYVGHWLPLAHIPARCLELTG